MDTTPPLYLSGMAMLNAVGNCVPMVFAGINAGMNRYQLSDFADRHDQPIRLAPVPEAVFALEGWDLDEGNQHSEAQDHALKMALHALAQLQNQSAIPEQAPLLLAMSEPQLQCDCLPLAKFKSNLERAGHHWLHPELLRSLHSGRAAGIEAVGFAYDYLAELYPNGIVIGASDSPCDYQRLEVPERDDRLLTLGPNDGYAPGEGSAFIALTADPARAICEQGQVLRIHPPGLAQEPGHWFSDEPYRGEGLDQAFKAALASYQGPPIHSIYSSMNGERYWAKEYGVAITRNRGKLSENVTLHHPAEYFGDLGSATAPTLIALAAQDLLDNPSKQTHLVYSSSDSGLRGALLIEKCLQEQALQKERQDD